MSWKDTFAGWLFVAFCGIVLLVLHVLGFRTLMFVGMVYLFRPPALRDPIPPPPVNFFKRLPCQAADDAAQ